MRLISTVDNNEQLRLRRTLSPKWSVVYWRRQRKLQFLTKTAKSLQTPGTGLVTGGAGVIKG